MCCDAMPGLRSSRIIGCVCILKGLSEKVPISDTHRDLTARQGAHNCCPCTHGKDIDPYHSCEAHKPYLWPRGMAINEHQLAESSIG